MAQRTEPQKEPSSPPDTMYVTLVKGQMTIIDYSKNNDRHAVMAVMRALGLKLTKVRESWCG